MAEIIKQGECLQDESTSGQGLEMHYTLTDDGTLTISGQGVVGCDEWSDDDLDHDAEMGCGWSDRFSHCSQFAGMDISCIVIEEGITSISKYAFETTSPNARINPKIIYARSKSSRELTNSSISKQ